MGEQFAGKFQLAREGHHFIGALLKVPGERIIGTEAWTWLGIPNRLADTLSDMKLASDLHVLAGENDLTGVDFAYSPRSVPPAVR